MFSILIHSTGLQVW